MGKGSKPTIGFWYRVAFHHGLTIGPIDAFLEFRGGDKTAWKGVLTSSGTLNINAPMLWGGEKDQGGIVGALDVMFGEPTQVPNPYLVSVFGPQTAAWRGFTTVAFKGGRYGAMNPYPRKASYKIRSIKEGWDNGCWYPEKAEIPMIDAQISMLGAGWEYQIENFTEPNTVWANWTIPTTGWQQGGELPFSTNGMSGGPYWTPTRSNIWLRRKMHINVTGLTLDIAADNGCVVFADGVQIGVSNPTNAPISSNDNNPVHFTPNLQGTVEIVVKAYAETDLAAEGGNIVKLAFSGGNALAANPAHVLYEARTAADMGRELTSSINDASLRAAADKLHAEGFGICPKWDPAAESIVDFEKRICKLIGGSFTRSLEDGQWYLDLARGDYVLANLPILTDDDILDFKEQPAQQNNAVNSVSVRYFNPEKKETIVTAPVRAMGLVAAYGTIHQTNDYPEIPTGRLAAIVAQRDVMTTSTPTRVFDLVTTRRTYNWRPNTYFRLQSPKRGIADMVCLVGEPQTGTLKSGAIRMSAAQDIYALPTTSFVQVEPGVDTRPPQTPGVITDQRAMEAPYVEVAAMLAGSMLDDLSSDAGFAMAFAKAPGREVDYTLFTAPTGGTYTEVAHGEWCASATVNEPGGYTTTSFTLAAGDRLASVTVGQAALWGDEIVRVDAIDAGAGTLTLGRGCADTVPGAQAAGTRIWFYGIAFAYDPTEYTSGESVNIKLLPNTGSQQLPVGSATAMSLTFTGRQALPYPPGKIEINAAAYPSTVSGTFIVTWAHRNRVAQADMLVDTTAASVTPAPNTRYGLRFLDAASALIIEQTDIGPATASVVLNYTGDVTLELYTIDDIGVSLQRHRFTFAYTPPGGSVVSAITATPYTPVYDGIIHDGGDLDA